MTSAEADEAPRGHGAVRFFAYPLAISIAIAAFFAFISPYGAVTYLPFAARFVYWLGLILLILGVDFVVSWALPCRNRPVGWIPRIAISTVLATPLVWLTITTIQTAIERPVPSSFTLQLLAYIWVICLVLIGLRMLMERNLQTERLERASEDIDIAAFRRLLPFEHSEAEIYAVSAEDHYIRVHTSAGETMLHMRLSDAEQLLDAMEGAKPHRSWWVSKAGIEAVNRKSGKVSIELKSGATVPVSRSGQKTLQELDWL